MAHARGMSAFALAAAMTAVAGCNSSQPPASRDMAGTPTAPAIVNPLTQSNAWTIYLTVDSCVSSRPPCPYPGETPGVLLEMSLRTATVGQGVAGVLTSRSPLIENLPVAMTGQTTADGRTTFRGTYQSESSGTFGSLDVQELAVRADDVGGLTGTLVVVQQTTWDVRTVRATIRSATRQPFTETARVFQGSFQGFGTLRACEGTCPDRVIGSRITVSMRLTQSGNDLDGEFGVIRVAGAATGTSMAVSGEWRGALEPNGVGTTLSRIESLVASVDALGRLTGTVRLYNEGQYDIRPGAVTEAVPFTERLTIELTTVVRQ